MEAFKDWQQFWIMTGSVVAISSTIAVLINNIATRALKKHKETNCNVHSADMILIQETNRVMLKCHDIQLQALDKIARNESPNGEIAKQREELQDFLRNKVTKKK
jgi:hypothetical protein